MIGKRVFIGLILISIFLYFFIWNEEFYAFIMATLLIFKSKALYAFNSIYTFIATFLLSSKSKILAYVKTLTIYKTIVLTIKRFLLDNVFSQWLNEVVINPIIKPLKDYTHYYFSLDLKSKFRKFLYFAIPISVFVYIIQIAGLVEHIVFFAEIKTIVIGFFKIVWLVSGKAIAYVLTFLQTSWLAPIIEIFALSWLITKLERIPYIGKYISRFFTKISYLFDFIIKYWNLFYNHYVYNKLSKNLKNKISKFSTNLSTKLEYTKHDNEIYVIKKFKEEFVKTGKIKEIIDKLGYEEADIITTKSLKLQAYTELTDGFVLLIESFASCDSTGNKNTKIKSSHFWILNYSDNDIEVISRNGYFSNKTIKPYKLILVKSLIQSIKDISIVHNSNYSELRSIH